MMFIKPALAAPIELKDQYAFGQVKSLGEALSFLVNPAFAIAGTAVAFYFVIGAVKLIISTGDKEKVKSAREMITHSIIGFIMLIMAFLIFQYLPPLLNLVGFDLIK